MCHACLPSRTTTQVDNTFQRNETEAKAAVGLRVYHGWLLSDEGEKKQNE